MTYERRVSGIVDRLIGELLFDPAVDLDTKKNIRAIRDELHELMNDIENSIEETASAPVA